MKAIYTPEKIEFGERSIFLAGPTPRDPSVRSWRPTALDILEDLKFNGNVLIPERRDWTTKFDYTDQVEWELEGLDYCKAIVFWVPRDLVTMPAFTTNVEFGGYVRTGRAWYGRPDKAPKCDYLDWLYRKMTNRTPHNNLRELLEHVSSILSYKSPSEGGCWYCHKEDDDLDFSSEFDTWVHTNCILERLQDVPQDPEALIMKRELGA
jgi:hypothetical protein